MSGKFRRATFLIAIVFAWVPAASLRAAENDSWVLAASPFEASDIGPIYSQYAEAVPILLLQRLGTGFIRLTPAGETTARELSTYRDGLSALLKARSELVFARDKTLLETVGPLLRARHEKTARDRLEAKEKELASYQKDYYARKTAKTALKQDGQSYTRQRVSLWEDGKKLYTPTNDSLDFPSLRKAGIQGIISGTLEDEAGYLVITLRIDTGVPGVETLETLAAGSYDELDSLVDSLSASIKTALSYIAPVTMRFNVDPAESAVFVDGIRVNPGERRLVLPEGSHRIDVSSAGYESASSVDTYAGNGNYLIDIRLVPDTLVPIAFSAAIPGTLLYIDTVYVGSTPVDFEIPPGTALGMAVNDDVPTWFYFTAASNEPVRTVRNNPVKTKTRIERQRSILYWSLGGLYISLPVSMLTYGALQDRLRAFDTGSIPSTDDTISEINGWGLASNVATGISVGLGINYVIQLIRYLLAAEQALPQEAGFAEREGIR